jgi:3-phytase
MTIFGGQKKSPYLNRTSAALLACAVLGLGAVSFFAGGCAGNGGSDFRMPATNGPLGSASAPAGIQPTPRGLTVVRATEPVPNDADDPAIWVHPKDPSKSLILGTDKHEGTGGLYVFDLNGKKVQAITPLDRPNNVDVLQGGSLGGNRIDLAVVSERVAEQIRIYKIDQETGSLSEVGGSTKILQDAKGDERLPMGVALWRRPRDGAIYLFVSPKTGPKEGYLAQYQLMPAKEGKVDLVFIRRVGSFSGVSADGEGEIEALVSDPQKGRLYFADEKAGLKSIAADPTSKPGEIIFGKDLYRGDREGLAVVTLDRQRVLLSSDQIEGGSKIVVWDIGGRTPRRIATLDTPSDTTDGIEAKAQSFGPEFPEGILVMMNSKDKNFNIFNLAEVKRGLQAARR